MHAAAIIGQGAAVLKYALPVSVVNCRVTHQVMLAFMLLFDVSSQVRRIVCLRDGLQIGSLYIPLDNPSSHGLGWEIHS